MIDTAGMGIRRSFEKLRERFFPMPDYDLTEENRVKVTIYGKIIDEKYSKLLLENTDLSLVEVMLLDRVQKNVVITKEQSDLLRKNKLIEGRYPHLYVSKEISEITNDKAQYIKNRGLSNDMYKEKILQYIKTYGKATRKEINELLIDQMPDVLSLKEKERRVKYLLVECLSKKENKIETKGSGKSSYWILKNN